VNPALGERITVQLFVPELSQEIRISGYPEQSAVFRKTIHECAVVVDPHTHDPPPVHAPDPV
jgi:hypothetical protein